MEALNRPPPAERSGRPAGPGRRQGDAIAIPGDYQHRALLEGPAVQRYWHQAKLELLDWLFTPRPGETVLDVGCGSGVFASHLASYGARVVAIDANPDAVAYAQRTFGREGVEFRRGLLDELDLEPGRFDRATALEIVEHVYPEQVHALFAALRRALKPGGRLLVTTPNYRGLWPLVEWAADRLAPTAQMDASQHVTRFHRARLRSALTRAGFEIETLRTWCTFAPFAAAVSWPAARRIDRLEQRIDWPFGNLLAAVARAPRDAAAPA